MSRASVAAAVLVAAVAGGCASGSGGSDDAVPTGSDGAASDAAGVGWSPCDGLDAAQVASYAGEPVTEQNGTADQRRCSFTPVTRGGAAYDVSYLFFDGSFDRAWRSMGAVAGDVRRIRVPGADQARMVVHARRSGVLVSGFVHTPGLVQSVNAVQLRPYDEPAVVGATTKLLAALVRAAPSG